MREQIIRPLRSLNGSPAVKYKKILRAVREGCIYPDGVPLKKLEELKNKSKSEDKGINAAMPIPPENTASKNALGQIEWDDSQRKVIEQLRDARVIVDAGPGTGKTAVACTRVAELIEKGVEPAYIWLISFTRTAMQEIRNRIKGHVKDTGSAAATS